MKIKIVVRSHSELTLTKAQSLRARSRDRALVRVNSERILAIEKCYFYEKKLLSS